MDSTFWPNQYCTNKLHWLIDWLMDLLMYWLIDYCLIEGLITNLSLHSNCPCSLAAALARATADSLLQSDLSIQNLNKAVEDGANPLPRESPGNRSLKQIRSPSQFVPHTQPRTSRAAFHFSSLGALRGIWPLEGDRTFSHSWTPRHRETASLVYRSANILLTLMY